MHRGIAVNLGTKRVPVTNSSHDWHDARSLNARMFPKPHHMAAILMCFTAVVSANEGPPAHPAGMKTVDVTRQFRLKRLWPAHKFDSPVALSPVPGRPGAEVVLLQRGEVWLLPGAGDDDQPELILNLKDKLTGAVMFEEGCHGLAFHPDFATNGKVYFSWSAANPRRSVLAEFQHASVDPFRINPDSARILLEVPHAMANHFGGGLAFGPDRMLYFAIGDGGLRDDPYRTAQHPLLLLGKMLRLDVDARSGALPYGIPADNPFTDKQDVRPEIFALGLRNPWGFSFDPLTGDLWLADVGQDLWEEVNLIRKGANYGWSDRDGAAAAYFHEQPFLPGRDYTDPVYAYSHAEGISITGGYVYRGEQHDRLRGAFLCGDWGHGTLWAVRHDADRATVTERLVLLKRDAAAPPFNPTMISIGADGEPRIMSQEGAIYTLVSADE